MALACGIGCETGPDCTELPYGTPGDPNCLGQVPEHGSCVACASDHQCALTYPEAEQSGCLAYCNDSTGQCRKYCRGECEEGRDAGMCEEGGDQCLWAPYGQPLGGWLCDTECGAAGGCRKCGPDSECERQWGAGSVCSDHCGVCCGPEIGCGCF